MASVFKPAGKTEWYIVYTDENGKRRKKQGYTDKRETQELAVKLEKRARKIKNGEIDPKDEAYRDHEKTPLTNHLEDFQRSVQGKGATAKHVHMVNQRARRLLDLGKMKRISELSLSKALEAVQALREEGLSQQSINHHIRAAKGFSRWLWSDGRARAPSGSSEDVERRCGPAAGSPALEPGRGRHDRAGRGVWSGRVWPEWRRSVDPLRSGVRDRLPGQRIAFTHSRAVQPQSPVARRHGAGVL